MDHFKTPEDAFEFMFKYKMVHLLNRFKLQLSKLENCVFYINGKDISMYRNGKYVGVTGSAGIKGLINTIMQNIFVYKHMPYYSIEDCVIAMIEDNAYERQIIDFIKDNEIDKNRIVSEKGKITYNTNPPDIKSLGRPWKILNVDYSDKLLKKLNYRD